MSQQLNVKKPSVTIRQALEDLRKVERSNKYDVDMSEWCLKAQDTCYVCFAGSVLVKRLDKESDYIDSDDFPDRESNALNALDSFRRGCYIHALQEYFQDDRWEDIYSIEDLEKLNESEMLLFVRLHNLSNEHVHYESNPNKFKRQMCKVANVLEKYGY
jgi:hypothetical protein